MAVSVIIPVYNAEKTLMNAVNSVLAQTYTDFELILVNDGSKDNTLEIMNSIKDERVKCFTIPNGGPSHARNYGMTKAVNERICFLDCDDTYYPSYLAELNAHEEDLVICKIHYEGEKSVRGYSEDFSLNSVQYPEKMEEMIIKGILSSPVTKLYRKDIIDREHLHFDESMKMGEDLNFNLKYLKYTKNLYYVAEELYLYNMNETGTVHRAYIPNVIAMRRINIDLLDAYFKKHHISNIVVNQLKVKLIYICVMQEIEKGTSNKDMWSMIDIPYFHEIDTVVGKQYQVMLKTYKTGNIHLIVALGKVLRKVRRAASSASV